MVAADKLRESSIHEDDCRKVSASIKHRSNRTEGQIKRKRHYFVLEMMTTHASTEEHLPLESIFDTIILPLPRMSRRSASSSSIYVQQCCRASYAWYQIKQVDINLNEISAGCKFELQSFVQSPAHVLEVLLERK